MREIKKYLLIIGIFFYSCNFHKEVEYKRIRSNGDIAINKTTYDKSGNLLTDEILNTDSVRDGYYKMWNKGKLSCIGNYTGGKKNGRWFYLDLLGDTVKIENWFSGKKFGEQSEYYSRTNASGKPLI